MSCAGYFEVLLHQQQEKAFKEEQARLRQIEQEKARQKKKVMSLQVQGDFHRANQEKRKLAKQETITARMKQLLSEA